MRLFQRVLVQNLPYENEFDLHKKEPVGGTHFRINKLTSVFHASVLLLIINFIITLSK